MANDTGGRPAYDENQYQIWLDEMKPFLQRGKSLYKALELSALLKHQTTIYEKYRLNDWFSQKVKAYQAELGEKINDTFVSLIEEIYNKAKRGEKLDDNELKTLMFGAEKHRSAQPFFVNRFETAQGRPVEDVIGDLEKQPTNETIDDVNASLKAEEQTAIPATSTPDPATQPQAQQQTPPVTEQPQPQIVEGQITPDAIDPNATPTT